MTGAKKILTVSYGTFSCTLEGFDDPLSTMQAIAEYFRRVAAEDRYFGAAPLTSDAAMLHRIAERAVNRRSEVPIEDTPMILRTEEAIQAAISPVPPAPQALSQPASHPVTTGLLAEESVAAKQQRLRGAVARGDEPAVVAFPGGGEDTAPVFVAPPAFSARTEDSAGSDEDARAQIMVPPDHDLGPAQYAADRDGPAGAPDLPVILGSADWHGSEAAAIPAERADDDTPEPAEPAHDAFGLERLTGNQSDNPVRSVNPAAHTVDTLPEALPELTAKDLPEAAGAADEGPPTSLDLAWAEMVAAFAKDAAAPSGPAQKAAVADSAPDAAKGPAPSAPQDVTSFASSWQDVLSAFEGLPEPTLPASAWQQAPDLPEPARAGAERSVVSDRPRQETQQALVLRATELSADPALAEPDGFPAAQSGSGNRADATRRAEVLMNPGDHARDTEGFTRLLHEANTEADEPENSRRLLTMAHFKPAVAAAETDLQSAGGESRTGDSTRLDRHSDDLARPVQQHRPDGPTPFGWSAPLVLVSEQRIDPPLPDGAVIRSLQQRISTTNLAVEQSPDDSEDPGRAEDTFVPALSFSEFAQQVGVGEMPDLLEAAAAYTACIEKQPLFTRPHLMRHVAAATGTREVNREDSMRNFGLLLRHGKIEKVDGGLFTITGSCNYLAQARRMTG